MSKKTKLLAVIVAGAIINNITIAFAAPTEIYGYKRVSVWDFNKNSYDNNGSLKVTPSTTIFDTHGQFQSSNKEHIHKLNTESTIEEENHLIMKSHKMKSNTKLDIISSASHKSEKKSSSDMKKGSHTDIVSGASNFIAADVVYDFDMLSNAIILKNLGAEDEHIDKIINNWNTTTRTIITKKGMNFGKNVGIDYDSYISKSNERYMNGQDITFEEFAENNKNKTRNLPYRAKYILQDGTYGAEMFSSEINALNAPDIKTNNDDNILGKDLVLKFNSDEKWVKSITDIQVGESFLDSRTHKILKNQLKIYNNKIIISADNLTLGQNTLKIHASGYKTIVLKQNIFKGKVNPKFKDTFYVNNNLEIHSLTKEYVTSIKKVILNGKVLKNTQWFIDAEFNKVILDKSLFKDSAYYKITIDTDKSFEAEILNVEVKSINDSIISKDDELSSKEKILPKLVSKDVQRGDKEIQIEFKPNKNWEKAIYKVEKIDLSPGLYKDLEFKVASGKILVKQNSRCFPKNNKYKLRIFAKGYEPADVYVNLYETHPDITIESIPTVGKIFIMGMSRDTFNYDWISNIKQVYIDGNLLNDKQYLKAIERLEIKPSAVVTSGKHRIIIKSTGFNDVIKDVVYFNEDGTRPNVTVVPIEEKKSSFKKVPMNVKVLDNKQIFKVGEKVNIYIPFGVGYEVSDIYLNGLKLDKNCCEISVFGTKIKRDVLSKMGKNTIKLKASGYEDKEIDITVIK